MQGPTGEPALGGYRLCSLKMFAHRFVWQMRPVAQAGAGQVLIFVIHD